VRVVAGDLKGRRLASPPRGADVRPTADRVREALFSILGDVSGARVLDLYCGTGALAIEALSRGASAATLVDVRPALARRNVAELDLADRAEVVRSDALRFLRQDGSGFDLIFCDPPYRLADRLERKLESLAAPRLSKDGRLIVESAARRPLRLELPVLAERTYGETAIGVYARADADPAAPGRAAEEAAGGYD
jgi:16S rRNA (guanine(966)-N(2))-methyltransferase RsmD